ncbi:hypothetical protein [Kitasatospora sp. NPDC088134]|uniref:hypothetical protein n=1 Tax=Kitasatospora sp. NPDC088134 TaxID=3364071 RepID=UPI00382F046F
MEEKTIRRWALMVRIQRMVGLAVLVPLYIQAVPEPVPELATMGGWLAGTFLAGWVWTAFLARPGSRYGLRVGGWAFGAGRVVRTAIGSGSVKQVRRFPLPVLRPLDVRVERPLTAGRLLSAALLVVGADLVLGQVLALVGGVFGRAMAVACAVAALEPVLVLACVIRPVSGQATGARHDPVAEEQQRQVLALLQRDVPGGRRALDALPPTPGTRRIELTLLLAEGRYRELVDRIGESTEGAAAEDLSVTQLHARGLAYLDELGEATEADREAFRALRRPLLRAPRWIREGSDLPALYELADGRSGAAIHAARDAAAVGSAPLRRSMAYATLALAHHRAGRAGEARAALQKAKETGPATARLEFLAALLEEPVRPATR